MISSANEFLQLRTSRIKEEYDRAAHEEAPTFVWLEVIENFPDLRKWVAHNKTVPIEILEKLSEFDSEVRAFVAVKRKLSDRLFIKLSEDPDATVRQGIASNKKTPLLILKKLAADADEDVARVARYNLADREGQIQN